MAYSVKYWLGKHEKPNSDPQHPCQSQNTDTVAHIQNWGSTDRQIPGASSPGGLAGSVSLRFSERTCLQKK